MSCKRRLHVQLVLMAIAGTIVYVRLATHSRWLSDVAVESHEAQNEASNADFIITSEFQPSPATPRSLSSLIPTKNVSSSSMMTVTTGEDPKWISVEPAIRRMPEEKRPIRPLSSGSNSNASAATDGTTQFHPGKPNAKPPKPSNLYPHDWVEWHDLDAGYRLKRDVNESNHPDNTQLCVPWEVNTDDWATHTRDWEEAGENETHYCFRKIQDPNKARYFRDLYTVQFSNPQGNNCRKLVVKRMWNSGWGADMMNVIDGLHHAYLNNQPFQIQQSQPWHYAVTKRAVDKSKPLVEACPLKNMNCYLLNMTSCSSDNPTLVDSPENPFLEDMNSLYHREQYRWYMEWLVRPQTWLRKRVYDFLQQQAPTLQTPCTVMHVRRNDVVLHSSQARKFHAIGEYVNASKGTIRPNILLLTDDHHAIGEAMVNFPQYHWMYIDRPRFRGVGGWEHQIPSDDPVLEVVVLFAIFRMVRSCDQIILSKGKFSDYLYEEMKRGRPSTFHIDKVDVDEASDANTDVLNAENSKSHTVSKNYVPGEGIKGLTSGGKRLVGEPLPHNKEFDGAFCLPWGVNVDDWWTHHVTWQLGADNATHQCFEPMTNKEKAKLFQDLYRIQFVEGNCSEVITKRMWSSGWGADVENLVDGLLAATRTGKPFQVGKEPWHYADNSVNQQQGNGAVKTACPKRNMFCYFLEVSRCRPKEGWEGILFETDAKDLKEYTWFVEFATRGQTWLRKEVADFVRKQEEAYFTTPCAVLHVRRGDAIDHEAWSRRYHAIEEYLDYAKEKQVEVHKNIFLVTDDYNAIGEAQTKYPQYNWMYIDRPRQRAENAQFEKHLASNDPTFELLVIQSIFRMVKRCDQILSSLSNFADHLRWEMESTGKRIVQLNLDQGKDYSEIFGVNNSATKNISKSYSTGAVSRHAQQLP